LRSLLTDSGITSLPALRTLFVFWTASNVYVLGLGVTAVVTKQDPLSDLRFSLRKFYALMGWAPLAFVALAVLIDVRYLALFVVAGLAGIVGELAMSVLWRAFFSEPIWTYNHRGVLRGYTSTLNFLPWAVGAFWFHSMGRLLSGPHAIGPSGIRPMLVSATAFALTLAIVWAARWVARPGSREFSRPAFAWFCLPIAVTGLALALLCDPRYLALMAAFSVTGFITEYAYGRSMSVFFERSLWTYNHWKIDGGHTSFVTFPLWALGGLYFHFISTSLGL
jgi:hypothetical protein